MYFLENYIDGTEFMSLSEENVRSIVPPIGLARKILQLQNRSVWVFKSLYILDHI